MGDFKFLHPDLQLGQIFNPTGKLFGQLLYRVSYTYLELKKIEGPFLFPSVSPSVHPHNEGLWRKKSSRRY